MKTLIFTVLLLCGSFSYADNVRLPCGAVIHPDKDHQAKAEQQIKDSPIFNTAVRSSLKSGSVEEDKDNESRRGQGGR